MSKLIKSFDDSIREKYDKIFDSKYFLKTYFSEILPPEEFTLRKLQDLFTRGILKGSIKRCIDIGCGPVVHRLSAASKVCETLVYSDFSSNNINLVQDWINGLISDQVLINMFKFCAQLEGFDDLDKGAIKIQNRIISKRPSVFHINVLDPKPLGQVDLEPFDVAFSGACLICACDSYESYVMAVKNIATLIRDDGYLILKEYLGGSYYKVNGVEFPALTVSGDMVEKALTEGGFKVLESQVIEHSVIKRKVISDKQLNDATGSCFVLAQKRSDV